MTDAEKVRLYQLCCQKAADIVPGIDIKIECCVFGLYKSRGHIIGKFDTIDSLYHFLCGLEWRDIQ